MYTLLHNIIYYFTYYVQILGTEVGTAHVEILNFLNIKYNFSYYKKLIVFRENIIYVHLYKYMQRLVDIFFTAHFTLFYNSSYLQLFDSW